MPRGSSTLELFLRRRIRTHRPPATLREHSRPSSSKLSECSLARSRELHCALNFEPCSNSCHLFIVSFPLPHTLAAPQSTVSIVHYCRNFAEKLCRSKSTLHYTRGRYGVRYCEESQLRLMTAIQGSFVENTMNDRCEVESINEHGVEHGNRERSAMLSPRGGKEKKDRGNHDTTDIVQSHTRV